MARVLRVLVVEDDTDLRTTIARALRGYCVKLNHQNTEVSFDVDEALTGKECLNQLESGHCPDFLILDAAVPEVPIIDYLRQLGRNCPACYTLTTTADESEANLLARLPNNRFDYLRKPFSVDELRFAMVKACERTVHANQSRGTCIDDRWCMLYNIISVVAHELKAPLAAIEGYLQICLDKTAGDNPELYDQMMERCLIRSQGMRKLINNLLDLSSIQTGRKKRELVEVDLVASARKALDTVRPEARKRQLTLNLRGPDSLKYLADRGEIDIIFNNLFSNAVKYNVPGGKVDVTFEETNEAVLISVSDSGIGILEQDCEKLFHEFMRIKNEKTREIAGTGLGLCIVKKIVELYRGSIDVKSAVGLGTTFTIILPRE